MKTTIFAAGLALTSSVSARSIRRQTQQGLSSYNVTITVSVENNGEWCSETRTDLVASTDRFYSRDFPVGQNLTNIELGAGAVGIACVTYTSLDWQPLTTLLGDSVAWSQDYPESPTLAQRTVHMECAPHKPKRPTYLISTFTDNIGQVYQYPDANGRIYRAIGANDSAMQLQVESGDLNTFQCYPITAQGEADMAESVGGGKPGFKKTTDGKRFAGGRFVCEPVDQ